MAFGNLDKQGEGDNFEDLAEINVIPLVDVMLVLLIIFMVAAPLSLTGISLDLPFSKAKGTSVEEGRIVLSVNKDGRYYIDRMEIPEANLEAKLKAIYQHRDKKELYIRADQDVKYAKVVGAMSAAKLAGVGKMNMLTRPKIN